MRVFVTALLLAAACGSKDNSADTDKASQDVRKASSIVSEKRDDVAAGGDEVERRKHEITKEQQELAAKETTLEANRRQLGSAQGTLVDARTAYAAAVNQRFTKLDAALAGLAPQTDAASKDAVAGLTARRDLLATRLSAMPAASDSTWAAYTKDVDTTFDAIERDLRSAKH